MANAGSVIAKCYKADEAGLDNEFYVWVNWLDWVDPFHTFITSQWQIYLSSKARADLYNDSFWWSLYVSRRIHKPWLWTNIMDIDKDSYYIARDKAWNIIRDDNWNALYKYHDTWELVNWETVKDKREKTFWFFSRKAKRMIAAPSWWSWVKESLKQYVWYIQKNFEWLMSDAWRARLARDIVYFIEDVESGNWKQWRYNVIYNLYTTPRGNHRYLMSEMLRWNTFDAILSDKDVAKAMLWYDFDTINFRYVAETIAAYASTARWWNMTLVDALWPKYADKIYGKPWLKLFDIDENWKVTRAKDPQERIMWKSYYMKLSIKQQIEQIRTTLWKNAPSMNKLSALIKIRVLYDLPGLILRWISFMWQPWVFSMLMSTGKWLTWFMPLLVLNSWMFVTDALASWTKLGWDWKWFFKKWNLNDWLPDNISWYSDWLGWTLWDIARKYWQKWLDAINQWLFNIWDMIMENTYRVRQYQKFFEAQFPWLKSVADINRELEAMLQKELDWALDEWTVDRLLDSAKWYAEYSVRLHTTNTPVAASLTRVHPTKRAIFQPAKDILYTMWHFFAWWGFNKINWAWKIVKTWLFDNIYHWKIWAWYLDKLLKWDNIANVNWTMVRTYLENEDLLYFCHKVYTAFLIGKYLDRLTESSGQKNEQNIFDDLKDLVNYLDTFSWDYAALWSTPQWRLVKSFVDNFVWELENNASLWTATQAWTAALTKEFFRSFFRKLYLPQIATETYALAKKDWDSEEINWMRIVKKSISDNVNAYLFYLKDKTENWEYSYYIPRWPNSYVNSILWMWEAEAKYINKQQILAKYANLFNTEQWLFELTAEQVKEWDWINKNHPFYNRIIYWFPFLKQYNLPQLDDVEWFLEDMDSFRRTREYQDMTNSKLPQNMTDEDYTYLFNLVTWRLINNKDKINNATLKWSYDFLNEYWEVVYDKTKQVQEDLIHYLMSNWLTEAEADKFSKMMDWETDKYDEEAIRTLAYMEAKTPWSSTQALAYIMSKEMLNYAFRSGIYYNDNDSESQKLKQDMINKWIVEAAKKYWKYVAEVDRYRCWPQFILFYAKKHDTPIAKYIYWPGKEEWTNGNMKLITPWTTVDKYWNIRQNKELRKNFQAQLMVDVMWAMWNPNARKIMNWYALIFDTAKYENKDWSLDAGYAFDTLNQLESVYDHIDKLALDNESERVIKQWTLMFWDKLIPHIVRDERLMARDDVRTAVNDWIHYRYKEFEELDQIATEAAEDQLSNDNYKKFWAKKNYLRWWVSKKFSWFTDWYNYMKKRAYSEDYTKYRVFDRTPRGWQYNYLSEWEFEQAKRAQAQFGFGWRSSTETTKKSSWGKTQEDSIGVSSRRWKAIQFYKREDIDKPVEYKTPWRKRWVRRWSWQQPISPTTWKHLTPKPKK